jgi:hypothetical protein
MAEFYFESAVFLRTADITAPENIALLARNSQKRLHIGVGTELLLKAIYLRSGYQLNKLADDQANTPKFPYRFEQLKGFKLREDKTFSLGELIDNLPKVLPMKEISAAMRGLRIAKVFRNKEGHVVYPSHEFDSSNYRDIETSWTRLYANVFNERLDVRVSLEPNEQPVWQLSGVRPSTDISPKGLDG